nr:carbonyl reductase 1 [Hymenolepis microstoma]
MKVAVVTGANRGIGKGLVEEFARELKPSSNWDIYLTARNEKFGLDAVKELAKKGLMVKFHQLDITDPDSRKELAQFISDKYPDGIHILVNNAGVLLDSGPSSTYAERAQQTMDINYTGNVKMCTEFMPLMAKDSRLVNMCTGDLVWAFQGVSKEISDKFRRPMTLEEIDEIMASYLSHASKGTHIKAGFVQSAYGISKLGFYKATVTLADQMKSDPRHILINCCCPGYVRTDMTGYCGNKTIAQGIDTPFYLATLPVGTKEPYGEFVSERQVVDLDAPFYF